jgi:hypothetical protein
LADLEAKILAVHRRMERGRAPVQLDPEVVRKILNSVDDPWQRRPHWCDVIKAPAFLDRRVMAPTYDELY